MKITFENSQGVETLVIESDGEGRYKISSDRVLARTETHEYETDDGLHVMGLLHLYFGAADSHEYLTRRLKEHEAKAKA